MAGTDADVYVTGSNAHILSSELSTCLAGRYVNIGMFSLSFSEWKVLWGNGMDDTEAFNRFMACGGFPSVDPSRNPLSVNTSLRDLYASIVKWDITSRSQIRNMDELDRLVTYLMHNIGNSISLNNIVEGMGAGREMIGRYLNLLEETFIIHRADRYDIRSTALGPHPKYYVVDQGIRDMAVGFTQKDSGRVLENIVYLELLRRGNTVRFGKYGAKEVDFVAFKTAGGREYYQVCSSIQNESAAERELSALRMTEDSFPKTVLTLDPVVRHVTKDGIVVMDVVEWLLDDL